ncbi:MULTISPECIES: exodeoxyribonuclease V subunit alpha [unclassified Paludibacterium]|uniref:exodeoxyribonuclease V subunit alpha n=1 Tax=unclassified Paludibacterium TaxID=2618429 RepID=UPI001C051DCF|nr:exodeoxyribonuclease V subunit alpha [Paludibacterium sp. B53371]BEV73265.1 exodeoxyribonuclease V subunit alpha [Paludibacterium sp. THUN1379]
MDTPLYPALNDLFRRLDPQWDEVCAEWLLALIQAQSQGHVCLPVHVPGGRRRLAASPLVGSPGQYVPLILEPGGNLYFARQWFDEVRLAAAIRARAARLPVADPDRAAHWLATLFPATSPGLDRQKLAAALALRQQLLVISGGPGTGKTTTVIRLLALLAVLSDRPLVMALAAPTGKAAARLSDAIRSAIDRLPLAQAVKDGLPKSAQTLHRLLGLRPGGHRPRHHAEHTLPLDVLVIDEASMIDLDLMARTFDALPPHARVILLGDRDQLASVEAGAVLAELCRDIGYREDTLNWLAQLGFPSTELPRAVTDAAPMADAVVLLTHSHRFSADGGIGALSRLVNDNQPDAASALLLDERQDVLGCLPALDVDRLQAGRTAYWQALDQQADLDVLQAGFVAFMPLAAERRQVAQINQLVEARLEAEGRKSPGQVWYPGRPVMISSNDYGVGLFNGDIGFTIARPEGLRVAFPSADGSWRELAPARLPEHDTVYAMTVHKSQGSEFAEVWLVLPEDTTNLPDRALVYTAITRARERFRLVGSVAMLCAAMGNTLQRHCGLADKIRST